MSHLEPVYLANVILYLPSIETIIKFKLINKKCEDATQILRIFSPLKMKESDDDKWRIIPKNLFQIFPKIQTIDCNFYEIKNNLDVINQVDQIRLKIGENEDKIPQQMKNKIISMDVSCYYLPWNINFVELTKIKKLKANFRQGDLKKFLGEQNFNLDSLIVVTSDKNDLDCLKDYRRIQNKIIVVTNDANIPITKERYYQLKSFATIRLTACVDGIDIRDSFDSKGRVVIDKNVDSKRLYDLSLFNHCFIQSSMDLKNFEYLEEVFSIKENCSVQVEGLNHLKYIGNVQKVDCIPCNVAHLSIDDRFDYEELMRKDENCFDNIRQLIVSVVGEGRNYHQSLLLNKLEQKNQENTLTFPINLTNLQIIFYNNQERCIDIGKMNQIKRLTIDIDGDRKEKESLQHSFNHLTQLEYLEANSQLIEGISLPKTITSLKLNVRKDIDLSQLTQLKEIEIFHRSGEKEVILPKKLSHLKIQGDLRVSNSNEIEVEILILVNTPSQHLVWQARNQIIAKEHQK